MTRLTWLVFFSVIVHSLLAQHKTVQGLIIDKTSGEPIPYVHVFLTSGLAGTISDLQGKFTIVIDPAKTDSLRFSSIGYETRKLPITDFLTTIRVVELDEDRVLLPVLIVHALSAKELVKKCVTKIPANYIQTSTEAKAFYWSAVRHEDTFTDFYEGYLRLTNTGIQYDSTVHSVSDSTGHIQLFDSLQDIRNFDVVNQASMFVNPVNIDDWKFEYLYSSEHTDGSFVVIAATMIQNPFEKNNASNTLKIFIHTPNYAIARVDFTYQWRDGKRYYWKDDVQYSLHRLDGTVEYTKNQNQAYGLSYLFIGTEFSFVKRYNPVIFKKAFINHELVILGPDKVRQQPVIRWSDYLDATNAPGIVKSASGQD